MGCGAGTLGDLTFIDAPAPKNTGELLQKLPFQGPGWYTLPAAQWLLHAGKINWDMCSHKIEASARHPSKYLKAAIATMEGAWDASGQPPGLAKDSINSMVGTFDLREDAAWLLRSSHHEDDLKPLGSECLKIKTTYGQEGCIFDYVFRTRLDASQAPSIVAIAAFRYFEGWRADASILWLHMSQLIFPACKSH